MKRSILLVTFIFIGISACKKEDPGTTSSKILQPVVLINFSQNVAFATYADLETKGSYLYEAIIELKNNTTDANLQLACKTWKDTRTAWEQSEAFLFGPVATEDMDPSIDDWPVNQNDLDIELASNSVFTDAYMDALQTSLKGFHPLEYILFGVNGGRTAATLTARQLDYAVALASYIKRLTTRMRVSWDNSTSENYSYEVINAGKGSTVYKTQRAIYEEIVNAMIGICDEVANGKIEEPLASQDPKLEESQFSSNSITDFKNNMISVQNVYMGKYTKEGNGLNKLVNANNISLDNKIQEKISAAINSFDNVTVPFGQAIITQQIQVRHVQDAIRDLQATLEDELFPFIQSIITE